ncbi:MAG: ribbon-helix-helix protein, CopG family [Acidobacteria bacterium]|nr:ribbon-helix-helix protein, CopG family [Acidobacteriota bacterium]MCG2814907.1 DUF6290 family protein [Candidatus Aminicenantes bacterium]
MIAVRLSDDIKDRLEKIAKRTGRTKSYYIRQAILEYLDDMEDYYLAEERMKTFSEANTISLQELKKRYDLED